MLYILYREQLSLIYLNSIPIPCKYLVHWLMSVWVLLPSSWNWAVCSKGSFATVRSGRLFFCLLLPFPYYPATHASHTCALTITVVINGGCQLRCQLFASVFFTCPFNLPLTTQSSQINLFHHFISDQSDQPPPPPASGLHVGICLAVAQGRWPSLTKPPCRV